MKMQADLLSFAPILEALDPALRQGLVFGGAFLLLAFPVIVLRVRPFSIAAAKDDFNAFIDLFGLAVLVMCGGLSGALFSDELVRSYAFSPLWYYALPAVSAASVYFQYASCKYPAMIRALSHGDDDVRKAAAYALGRLGDKQAADPLAEALSDDADAVGKAAAYALGLLGDTRAVDPLIEDLADDDSRVHGATAEALGRLGDERAVDPLIEVLANHDSSVREAAAKALQQLGQPEWATRIRGDYDDFRRLGLSKDPRVVVPLIEALSDDDSDVRKAAAKALGRLSDKRAVKPLVKALSDDEYYVRGAAAKALGQLGDKRAVVPLIEALADDNSRVRR
ncbi:MAG: HEAT repeat domain-containing protein, partial [Phycisphaerae bacterium]|nr:HEAT repeat domain-containing protein [Phycisphaerae bacterium]